MSVVPQSILADAPAGGHPHSTSIHEDLVTYPPGAQADVVHRSVSETRSPHVAHAVPTTMANVPSGGPAVSVVPPAGTLANVPSGNGKAPKTVWETNHAKSVPPATTAANVPPGAAGPGSVAPAATSGLTAPSGGQPPATTVANVPPAEDPAHMSSMVPSQMPAGSAGPPPAAANIPATGAPGSASAPAPVVPASAPSKGSRKGVRWDSHIPGKDVVVPPAKTPPPSK